MPKDCLINQFPRNPRCDWHKRLRHNLGDGMRREPGKTEGSLRVLRLPPQSELCLNGYPSYYD